MSQAEIAFNRRGRTKGIFDRNYTDFNKLDCLLKKKKNVCCNEMVFCEHICRLQGVKRNKN